MMFRNQDLTDIKTYPERYKKTALTKIESRTCSPEILAEGEKLAKEMGCAKAAKTLGISENVLRYYIIGKRNREKLERNRHVHQQLYEQKNGKYTMAQKIACIDLAYSISKHAKFSLKKSFISAGERLGVNGYSIQKMYQAGLIPYEPRTTY